MRSNNTVLSYDIVTVPSASPARRGLTFQTITSRAIRLHNVEKWRRNRIRNRAKHALSVRIEDRGAELARVTREAFDMAQRGSMQHRAWGKAVNA